ncbi:MAG: hypothetical protein ACJ78Q_14690 [Chloroflexia bacterium]
MNSWLTAFSDWTLALLPRLLLYPGGLWALFMLLPLYLLTGVGGRGSGVWGWWSVFSGRSRLSVGVAWAGLALLPLPGAAALPFPVDRLSLVGLLVTSLALEWHSGVALRGTHLAPAISANVAVVLAAAAPLAGGRGLLQPASAYGSVGWLSACAVAAGLVALLGGYARDPAAAVRWLAWFGLALAPLWASSGLRAVELPWVWVGVAYLVGIMGLAGLGATGYLRRRPWLPVITCWGLAALSVLAALLG